MELKAVMGLQPGAVGAEDVLDHNGNVIIKKNTSLDKFLIQKLLQFSQFRIRRIGIELVDELLLIEKIGEKLSFVRNVEMKEIVQGGCDGSHWSATFLKTVPQRPKQRFWRRYFLFRDRTE